MTKLHKTRKPHRCWWCDEAIEIGSEAISKRGRWIDAPKDVYPFPTFYWHVACWDLQQDANAKEDPLDMQEYGMPRAKPREF